MDILSPSIGRGTCIGGNIYITLLARDPYIYSYVTAVRYVSAINHEARGRAAPEGE